jgi:hypothetical protein
MITSAKEVSMSIRLMPVLLIFLATPAFSQTSNNVQEQASQHIWARGQMMRPDSAPDLDLRAARLQAIDHDATDLSVLSTSLQSDLQQLHKGLFSKDLGDRLRRMEKLAKRLRQEVTP